MDEENKIYQLIIAYLKKEISTDEQAILQDWIQAKESHRLLFEELLHEEKRQNDIREYASFHTTEQWLELKQKMNESSREKYNILKCRSIAAAVTILLAVAATLIWQQQSRQLIPADVEIAKVVPGSSQAILIGGNGQQIKLEDTRSENRKLLFGTDTLEIQKGHSLKYGQAIVTDNVEWHTLRIPRGGEFQLVLEDGTEIWLNSETELKYPAHFTGHERRVELSGEAYFKVVPNPKMPFIVNTAQMDTRVLGTSFNISAYPDENKIHTTLIEGSVEINDKENGETVRLKPGEQALLQEGQLSIQKVDTKLYSLWRMDRFTFSSESLGEVIRKLSRWYNVEFFFANSLVKQKQFTGSLPKYSDISQVLSIIEMTTKIKFQIKNNTIIIQ